MVSFCAFVIAIIYFGFSKKENPCPHGLGKGIDLYLLRLRQDIKSPRARLLSPVVLAMRIAREDA
jgi:hypothetical protein